MNKQPIYQVVYNDEIHQFTNGAQLYIFDCGLFWDMDKLGNEEFNAFIRFAYDCYLEADDPIPLGALTDYIAQHWEDIKDRQQTVHQVLDKFWRQLN